MAIQVTVIGLGQIGASIGLALAEHKESLSRVGHDRELRVARKAEKMGAVDRVSINLPDAVRQADLVVLAVPLDEMREVMRVIAQDLKKDAVVVDLAPIKTIVNTWAEEILPPSCHYVGLTPVLNPAYLHDWDSGIDAAHADLFRKGLIAIITPARAASAAIRLATDFIHLLGAAHMFADPLEVDSLMAASHILPHLMAAALVNVTVDQPGWQDGRKMAGQAFAEVTYPIVQLDETKALSTAALQTHQSTVRMIDQLIAALQNLRADIDAQEAAKLEERLEMARDGRMRWWHERQAADWTARESKPATEMPSSGDWLGRVFGLRRPKPKK